MENAFWDNKVATGIGTRFDFIKSYKQVSEGEDRFVTASTLFPALEDNAMQQAEKHNGNVVYEYFIYYKVKPSLENIEDKGSLNNPITESDNVGQGEVII